MNNVIFGASAFTETTLLIAEEVEFFQVPDESVIYHSFHDFTKGRSESYCGLYDWASRGFFPGWNMGVRMVSFHLLGHCEVFQIML